MDNKAKHIINSLTNDIICEYGLKIPFDIEGFVVRTLGGTLREEASIFDGTIMKCGNSFQIRLSTFQDRLRKRFTIAHELGHLFLHMGFKTNDEIWNSMDNNKYYRFGSSEREYQANEFAASLLMPEKMYINTVIEHAEGNIVDISIIANIFQVSIEAASNRGKFLGILKW